MCKRTRKMLGVLSLFVIFLGIALILPACTRVPTHPKRIKDDEILSKHIKEADGTTEQDTNLGSGIKTDHIQDEGVTSAKIGFYSNVIIVALNGKGDYDDPATALESIIDASTDNTYLVKIMPGVYFVGTNSVQMKEYVDIEGSGEGVTRIKSNTSRTVSGVVNGASNAELSFLTVENINESRTLAIYNKDASPKITNVTAIALGGVDRNYGFYNISSSFTMTNVTAISIGGHYSTGIHNSGGSPTMTNVTATASGSGNSNTGISNSGSSPIMRNVVATGLGGSNSTGIYNAHSSPTMINVIATGKDGDRSYGVHSRNGGAAVVRIDHSVITGATNTIYTESAVTTYVGNTRLDGGAVSGSGTNICAGVYDENYTFYPDSCP